MAVSTTVMNSAKIVGAIAAILTFWFTIESRFDENLRDHTSTIIEANISDLRTRVIILNMEIEEYVKADKETPARLQLEKQLMEKQIEELKAWGE